MSLIYGAAPQSGRRRYIVRQFERFDTRRVTNTRSVWVQLYRLDGRRLVYERPGGLVHDLVQQPQTERELLYFLAHAGMAFMYDAARSMAMRSSIPGCQPLNHPAIAC